jgi:two-component system sensor kinase FixL
MDEIAPSSTALRQAANLVAASLRAELVLSPDLTIVACSDAYLRALGGTRQAIVGRSIREVFAEGGALRALIVSLETVCRTGRPHRVVLPGLAMIEHEAGIAPARTFAVETMPVLGEDGAVKWLLQGIEALENGEPPAGDHPGMASALEAAEARLRSVLQTVPDAMIIIDEQGRIESLSATAERLFGYPLAEAAGQNVSLLMPSPDRENHDVYLKRYLTTGERRIIGIGRIVVGQRKDGTTFPMHLTVGELRSAERHYFTGFIRDLTEQQLTESRLKELQSEVTHMSRFTALGEMASTLAHEINQPLTAISNYLKGCQRLLAGVDGEQAPVLRDALGKAADQALRAGQIIRRLREFVARGESEPRTENLPKLIEDASTLALIGARENGVNVSFRLDPEADLVFADRIQIQQVLVNLIRNAIESMAEGEADRRLEIATATSGQGTVEIAVSDTGPGLAPEIARHLFQPFMTTKRKGMGLGLSICRTIVEAHGGKIWVEDRAGGGTIFRFTLRSAREETSTHGG